MKIIDVSYHNGNINFKKVAADGIDGVIIRAGYGSGHIDKKFIDNIKGARSAGLPVGVYWFSYAYSVGLAHREAQQCLDAIKPYTIDLGVFFDWEYDSMRYAKNHGVTPNKKLITQLNRAFVSAIKDAGYKAGIYFNKDYANRWIDTDAIDCIKWYARYTSAAGFDCDLWQYTSSGKVDGISGHVDINKVINKNLFTSGSFGSVKKSSGSSGSVKKPKKKSVDTIAKEVIAGKWGDGTARVQKLKAAGYDPETVQKKVNALLKVSGENTTVVYHRVSSGETLSGIAKKYKTSVDALLKLNRYIGDPNKIYIGQEIRVK